MHLEKEMSKEFRDAHIGKEDEALLAETPDRLTVWTIMSDLQKSM